MESTILFHAFFINVDSPVQLEKGDWSLCQDSLFTHDLKLQFDLIPFLLFTFRGMLAKTRQWKKAADSLSSASRLLNVLEVIAPFKHFNKLREFVQMKLPPGFPVKLGMCVSTYRCVPVSGRAWRERSQSNLFSSRVFSLADIPVFPTITATVTFQEFRYDEFEESTFFIPAEYKEDPSRFPDLWPVNTSDKKEMTSKLICAIGGKQKMRNPVVLFLHIYILSV